MHTLEPFGKELDAAIGTVHQLADGTTVTPAKALLAPMLSADESLAQAYERCLSIAIHGFLDSTSADHAAKRRYRTLILRQLILDRERLPTDWLSALWHTLVAELSVEEAEQFESALRNVELP